MANIQRYGIKFPITILSSDNTLIDLNEEQSDEVYSQLIHLIFTPKGQRLRNPDFGTRLIQYIFNPNDSETWGDILMEIKETVSKYIPMCSIQQLEVEESENGIGLVVKMKYIVKSNNSSQEYSVSINI
ncbi:putative uncharacterized protein [Prevotella sp. CAG:1092]|nr:putative uncharacterized protein [Prevotella sp. CAG:1092]